jgi:hypothetical protein
VAPTLFGDLVKRRNAFEVDHPPQMAAESFALVDPHGANWR